MPTLAKSNSTHQPHRTLADKLLGRRLARPEVPVYWADGTRRSMAEKRTMADDGFVAAIASVVRRADGAICRIFLKARPNEIGRQIAEDSQTTARWGRGFRHLPERCEAYFDGRGVVRDMA